MKSIKRVFLIVLDSLGIGAMPDANLYGDEGSNTLKAITDSGLLNIPNLTKLGIYNIDGVGCGTPDPAPIGSFARMNELSNGKDTIIGHWEIAGVVSEKPMPTYPNGFPEEIIKELSIRTGHKIICNKPYSGTDVIVDFGKEQMENDALIVYTSADSVMQIAAHEDIVPLNELYACCQSARELLSGEHSVGRVIARPFNGSFPNFTRTANRRDYALLPPKPNMCELLAENGYASIAVGKISDIFAGQGITKKYKTHSNDEGMDLTLRLIDGGFNGLAFINLVDFDMMYGHRNNIAGYADALNKFDVQLGILLSKLKTIDALIITADHGCDPSTASTDHSREYTPMLFYSETLSKGVNLGTRNSFADISATILDIFPTDYETLGKSFLAELTPL
ncbi:MAG: phosphopentomutase [Oscillospiraceae bacterium]